MTVENPSERAPARVRSWALVVLGLAFLGTAAGGVFVAGNMYIDSTITVNFEGAQYNFDRVDLTRGSFGVAVVGILLFFLGKGRAQI